MEKEVILDVVAPPTLENQAGLMHLSLCLCVGQGRTVVTTIHQPNSTITDCFDDLLLLSFGNLIYMGKWAKSVEYFSSLGYK